MSVPSLNRTECLSKKKYSFCQVQQVISLSFFLSHTHILTLSICLSLSHTFILPFYHMPCFLPPPLSVFYTHIYAHTFILPLYHSSIYPPYIHTHTLSHILRLSQKYIHIYTLSFTEMCFLSHTHTHIILYFFSLSRTHTFIPSLSLFCIHVGIHIHIHLHILELSLHYTYM